MVGLVGGAVLGGIVGDGFGVDFGRHGCRFVGDDVVWKRRSQSRVAPRMRSALAKRKLPMVGSDVLVVSACLGHCLLCFERSGSKTEINTRLPLGDTPAPSVVSLVAQKDPGSTACLLLLTHSVSHSQSVNSEYTKY